MNVGVTEQSRKLLVEGLLEGAPLLSVGEYVDGMIGRRIVDVPEERDCDHLFLLGRKQRPFGSIFGRDAVHEALDEFDGFVTVSRETTPENRPGNDDSLWDGRSGLFQETSHSSLAGGDVDELRG